MGSEFTFYDYIDADGSRVDADGNKPNIIRDWLNGEGRRAKSRFSWLIGSLEASPPPQTKDTVWKPPFVKFLDSDWQGFIELRKTGRVQYRLIGKIDGRNVLLVAYGTHKDQHFSTDVSPGEATKRTLRMINRPATYRRKHEYN